MPSSPPMPWWALPGLAVIVLLIFAGALVGSFLIEDQAQRNILCGSAMNLAALALGYFFGSSTGSERKDKTIADATGALATSSPAPVVTTTKTEAPAGTTTTTTEPAHAPV